MSSYGPYRRQRRLVAPLLATLVLSAACSTTPAEETPAPRRHLVEVRSMTFDPAELTVAPGDTVVWINRDIVPHTATARGVNGWDTNILVPGDSGSFVADGETDGSYVCTLHPGMKGRLIVATPSL